MKLSFVPYSLCAIVTIFSAAGCDKHYDVIEPGKDAFDFFVTEEQRQYINSTRGLQYEVTDPLPVLNFAGETYTVDRFEVRGDNTLNFFRKSFGVNLGRKITLYDPENKTFKKYEEFKMLAMVYDYTYIENSTATGLFRQVGLWPVGSFFTEVRLNGHTQGLYFFIEDPFEYFMEQKNAPVVIRRGYDHVKKAYAVSPASLHEGTYYFDRFRRIYNCLPEYSGKAIYDTLSNYIDLEQYFTKLSIDLIMKNGDYTDEVIFFIKEKNGREVFGTFPWDVDDIFASQPHEIGNDWAPGTVFGPRAYYSADDVLADVGFKLLYSIEDDLDYKIAKDSYLYQEYLKTLRKVIEKIDAEAIDDIFDKTFERVSPFYRIDSIVNMSQHDVNATDYDLFVSNLADKRVMIKERRDWILQELNTQQNR